MSGLLTVAESTSLQDEENLCKWIKKPIETAATLRAYCEIHGGTRWLSWVPDVALRGATGSQAELFLLPVNRPVEFVEVDPVFTVVTHERTSWCSVSVDTSSAV